MKYDDQNLALREQVKRLEAERDALRAGIEELLDAAWVRIPPEAEARLRDLIGRRS